MGAALTQPSKRQAMLQHVKEGALRRRAGYLEGFASIAVNVVLFAIKYLHGVWFNSVAVIADSVHSLSDSLTSAIVVVGSWVAHRPADREHPFGHGRAEALAAVIIGSMLIVVGFNFLQAGYERLANRESLVFGWPLVGVLAASAAVKAALTVWSYRLGKSYGLQMLVADAWHHLSDAAASAILATALVLGGHLWWLDGALALAVSAMIAYTGAYTVLGASRNLLGRGPTEEEVRRIRELAYGVSPALRDVHHIHVHEYGDHIELTLHVRLPPTMSVAEAHRLASEVEKRIREAMGCEATVHVEPASDEREGGGA